MSSNPMMNSQQPSDALNPGPETGQMLSTYLAEVGQPLSTFTG